jgi:hypothetical protein
MRVKLRVSSLNTSACQLSNGGLGGVVLHVTGLALVPWVWSAQADLLCNPVPITPLVYPCGHTQLLCLSMSRWLHLMATGAPSWGQGALGRLTATATNASAS